MDYWRDLNLGEAREIDQTAVGGGPAGALIAVDCSYGLSFALAYGGGDDGLKDFERNFAWSGWNYPVILRRFLRQRLLALKLAAEAG